MHDTTTGHYLRSVRLQLGLSQVDLAAHLGVSNVSINRWERDKVQPDASTLNRYRQLERDGIDSLNRVIKRVSLPRPATPIFGREQELRELSALLIERPLITIFGTGGAGKTRIAAALGEAVVDQFADGVWFVDLSQLVDQVSVAHACAETMGLSRGGRRPLVEQLASHLSNRKALLILDNCEHVIPACAEIAAAWLALGGHSRLVATSRTALDVTGEAIYALPPIAPSVAELILVERVRARRPGYNPEAAERRTIGTLCERLDQLPLAIELAAARMQVLSADQIVERLDRRFEILQTSDGRPSRQRTLSAAIGWSCDLLEPAEAELFRVLGVFSGWFDLAAVEAIAGEPNVVALLDRLASQSMILVEHGGDGSAPRYRLLDSLAAYARRWLEERGEGPEHRRRHAEHYRNRIAPAAQGLHGAEQAQLLKHIDQVYENAIAALTWSLAAGEGALVLSLTNALSIYWQRRGRYSEGCAWIEQSMPFIRADRTEISAAILISYSTMLIWLGRFEAAERQLAEALRRSLDIGARGEEARANDAMGLLRRAQGNLAEARSFHLDSIAIADEIGDPRAQAMGRINLGHISNLEGDHAAAESAYMDALVCISGRGDLAAESAALANLGEVAGRMGKFHDALGYVERALAMARELGDPERVAILIVNEAEVLLALGDSAGALKRVQDAALHFRNSGSLSYLAGTVYLQGIASANLGRRVDGLLALRESLQLYRDLGDWVDVAFTIEAIARVFAESGDASRAARWLGGAEAIRLKTGTDPYPMFDYDGPLQKVKTALDGNFASVWATGRTLSQERLVVEVLHAGRVVDTETQNRTAAMGPAAFHSALTMRQLEILGLAAEGMSNREIASQLSISPRTVERHLTAVFTILGVERRASAIALAVESGLLSLRHS